MDKKELKNDLVDNTDLSKKDIKEVEEKLKQHYSADVYISDNVSVDEIFKQLNVSKDSKLVGVYYNKEENILNIDVKNHRIV